MANSVYQTVSVKAESTYSDAAADMSSGGALVRTVGKIDTSSLRRGLVDAGVNRQSANDAGVAPTPGLDEGEIKIVTQLYGNTRAVAEVGSDGMSVYLTAILGTRNSELNDECLADCTTTVIKATAHPYAAGDLVMIGGEVRRVASDDGADQFTLDMPLTSAPALSTVIYGVEQFEPISTPKTIGVGITCADSEMEYLIKGANVTSVELEPFTPGAIGKLTANVAVGSYSRTAITHSTTDAGQKGVVIGRSGPGLQLVKADGTTLWSPCVSTLTAQVGVERKWIADIGATMGKCGAVATPTDATVEFTAYQDSTLSTLEALPEIATVINVQVGATAGAVWGIYYPEAFLSEGPQPADIEETQGVSCKFRTTRGILYRA
jgi:hypothetical protein